ncbi:MAG: EamA family transporter [Anaerolineae bacterium]|nr:EamA family transporter [Anaerolineae bacterium]
MIRTETQTTDLTRGYTIGLIAALILSLTSIFIRHLTVNYGIPALVLAFWRDLFVVLVLTAALAVLGKRSLLRIDRRHLPYFVIYGLVLALFNSLWTLSVALNGASVATVLVYCSAAFTALLGWAFLKESLGWVKMAAVVLSVGGCVLVADALNAAAWQVNLIGILTGIAAGLLYAVYSLMGRSGSQNGLNTWTILFYTFSFATGFLLVFNLIPGGPLPGSAAQAADLMWLGQSMAGWGILFILSAGPTLAGYGMYVLSMSYLPSSVANLIVSLEPAFTAVIAYFVLGEMLTGVQIGGSLMILAGVVLLRIGEAEGKRIKKKGKKETPIEIS